MAFSVVPIAPPMTIGLQVVSISRKGECRWSATAEATINEGEVHCAIAEARTPHKAQARATALALKQALPKTFLSELC